MTPGITVPLTAKVTLMDIKPKPAPKPEPSATQPRETAQQALQQSMDRRW